MDADEAVTQQLQQLRVRFRQRLMADLAVIKGSTRVLATQGWQPVEALSLMRALHTLAGTGGTFGFQALSAQAKQLERRIDTWLTSAEPPNEKALGEFEEQILLLEQCVEAEDPPRQPF